MEKFVHDQVDFPCRQMFEFQKQKAKTLFVCRISKHHSNTLMFVTFLINLPSVPLASLLAPPKIQKFPIESVKNAPPHLALGIETKSEGEIMLQFVP